MNRGKTQIIGSHISKKEVFFLTFLLVGSGFFFQGNVGFSLGDEGYLWQNTQQTRAGAVPVRDFRSYDPGRYYWTACWVMLLGDGLFTLRLSLAMVQAAGLFFGLLLIKRIIRQRWLFVLIAIVLLLWMFPRIKVFEHAIVLCALFFSVELIEKPDRIRHFMSGFIIGAAALFGKNLGWYLFLSFFSLILVLGWRENKKELLRNFAVFSTGLFIGYLPMILLMLFLPGFFVSFIDSISRLFGPYAPVKYLSIPWPWKTPVASEFLLNRMRIFLEGIAFVFLFAFYIIGIAVIVLSRRPFSRHMTLLIASIFIGVPLLNYVSGRADFVHLAQGVHPMLFGLIAVAVSAHLNGRKTIFALTIFLFIGLTAVPFLSSSEVMLPLQWFKGQVLGKSKFVQYKIYRNTFWLPRTQVNDLNMFMQFLSRQMRPDENILIAPYAPGLYCLLNKKSSIWDAYPIHLAPSDEQMRSIRDMEIKNVCWALIDTFSMDRIKERSFPFTHELIWRYILREFEPVECPGLSKSQILFRRRARILTY